MENHSGARSLCGLCSVTSGLCFGRWQSISIQWRFHSCHRWVFLCPQFSWSCTYQTLTCLQMVGYLMNLWHCSRTLGTHSACNSTSCSSNGKWSSPMTMSCTSLTSSSYRFTWYGYTFLTTCLSLEALYTSSFLYCQSMRRLASKDAARENMRR